MGEERLERTNHNAGTYYAALSIIRALRPGIRNSFRINLGKNDRDPNQMGSDRTPSKKSKRQIISASAPRDEHDTPWEIKANADGDRGNIARARGKSASFWKKRSIYMRLSNPAKGGVGKTRSALRQPDTI